MLGEWVSHLLFNGYSLKTATFYLRRLGALYSKAVAEGLAKETAAFSALKSKLTAPGASRLENAPGKDTFSRFNRLICADLSKTSSRQLVRDMLVYAVYLGGMTAREIADCRKEDYKGDNPYILAIISRYSNPKRKYLFPLDRSAKHASQLAAEVERGSAELLRSFSIKVSAVTANLTLDVWCAIAAECGIPRAEIAACAAPRQRSNAVTAFVDPEEIDETKKRKIRDRVVNQVTDNPLHWYAMQLRRCVNYKLLASRLDEKKIELDDIYYPMHDIIRKVGDRQVFENTPVVSWLLFFRARASELNRLFHEIGDLAWGYRSSRTPGSPYAIISAKEIYSYQTAISTLSTVTCVMPEGSTPLQPGDRLIIIGGLFNGRPATFESVATGGSRNAAGNSQEGEGNTIYRILLDGGKSCEWVVHEDACHVKRISEEQFQELSEHNCAEEW